MTDFSDPAKSNKEAKPPAAQAAAAPPMSLENESLFPQAVLYELTGRQSFEDSQPNQQKIRPGHTVKVDAHKEFERLRREIDARGDHRITVEDFAEGSNLHDVYALRTVDGREVPLPGVFAKSNLAKILARAVDEGQEIISIDLKDIFESPVTHLKRFIAKVYWQGLQRQIDEKDLLAGAKAGRPSLLGDSKIARGEAHYLHVPAGDRLAVEYFTGVAERNPQLNLRIAEVPAQITPDYLKSLGSRHGLLSLALRRNPDGQLEGVPFVVPGGRFNEMYGWDGYFETLGLLNDNRVELACALVTNYIYEVMHYGKILNANRTYYLGRAQPPFLTSMALAVYEKLPAGPEAKEWLRTGIEAAIKEYWDIWMGPERLDPVTKLSRYAGSGHGPPPEVEPNHFDRTYAPFAAKHKLTVKEFAERYRQGKIHEPELDQFFQHDRAVRESGHDTCSRWRKNGRECCSDFVTVDLNSLLYRTEMDIYQTIEQHFDGALIRSDGRVEHSEAWAGRALKRRNAMLNFLWDENRSLFFDYDIKERRQHDYISATTFYPLWAFHPNDPIRGIVAPDKIKPMVDAALNELELPGGLVSGSLSSLERAGGRKGECQWDYPQGWAPHQIIAWQGLNNYGMTLEMNRLIYRWLYMMTLVSVNYSGTIPEKYNVQTRSARVDAEYGNQGHDFQWYPKEGFGWTNASYQIGLSLLHKPLQDMLHWGVPPEQAFWFQR